jgi:D-sedoheptulose 7-phosphate isomerase
MKPVLTSEALVTRRIRDNLALKQQLLADAGFCATIAAVGEAVAEALRHGGKVFFLGNGGSAADAQHLAAELTGRYLRDRRPLAGIALTTNTSSLSAIGNDYGFDQTFSRPLSALGNPGDVVVGISTSGNSPNVIKAMEVARAKGMVTVAMTGRVGRLKEMGDFSVCIPSDETPRIQEAHILVGHIICEIVEEALCGESNLP